MTRLSRHSLRLLAVAAAGAALLGVAACGDDSSSGTDPDIAYQTGVVQGDVDTSRFEGLLTECEILPATQIAETVGGQSAQGSFVGALCRWVVTGGQTVDVTLNWWEWGNINLEKQTAQNLGFTTENIQVHSMAAFTSRDPARPEMCGVTAKSPGRGVLTWWVEPHGAAAGDPCEAPRKLMEMVLDRAN